MVRQVQCALILLLLCLYPAAGFADGGGDLSERVVRHVFKNGLTVVMVERHFSPTISFNIGYKAGSVNEHLGDTGIAHLYEHMAFKGTETVGTKSYKLEKPVLEEMDHVFLELKKEREKGEKKDAQKVKDLEKRFEALEKKSETFVVNNEIGEIYTRNGASGFNASTGKDMTLYTVSLPSNRFSLWASLENDRMTHPVLREFYKEKQVVLEERRMRVENSPSGKLHEALLAIAFWVHPYGLPGIGWTRDVQSLTRSETEAFFKEYYSINNVVIAIVGDIEPQEVIQEMEKNFGRIAPRPVPPPLTLKEPEQEGERRVHIEYDANPFFTMAFHRPDFNDPDDAVFDVIESLLSSGRTSLLYKHLVTEKQIAISVSADSSEPGTKYPSLFMISGAPRAPHTLQELEAALWDEITRLKEEPVKEQELQKVINQFDGSLTRSLESNSGLASQLAYFEAVTGDWKYLVRQREKIKAIKPEDVQRVVRKYFTRKNRIVATLSRPEHDEKVPQNGGK